MAAPQDHIVPRIGTWTGRKLFFSEKYDIVYTSLAIINQPAEPKHVFKELGRQWDRLSVEKQTNFRTRAIQKNQKERIAERAIRLGPGSNLNYN